MFTMLNILGIMKQSTFSGLLYICMYKMIGGKKDIMHFEWFNVIMPVGLLDFMRKGTLKCFRR